MRISRVAVRPSSSLALATSCTPGSCTTMRSLPCCWMTGSATPSSLMRLCRVLMFWVERAVLHARDGGRAERADQLRLAAGSFCVDELQVGQARAQGVETALSRSVVVGEGGGHAPGRCGPTLAPAIVLVAQHAAHVGRPASRSGPSGRPACRPAAGSTRRRAGPGPGTWACGSNQPRARIQAGEAGQQVQRHRVVRVAVNGVQRFCRSGRAPAVAGRWTRSARACVPSGPFCS